jgi:hypothetical protein
MKLKTADLRTAVDAAIVADRDRHNEREQARQDEYQAARKAWVAEHKDAWNAACTDIRDALRRGEPVTLDMLPKDGGTWQVHVQVFSATEPKPDTYGGPSQALIRVRTALRLVTDAEVSMTTLQQLGVSSSVLRDVLDLMPSQQEAK